MANTGDLTWGHMASTEKYGRASSIEDYEIIPKEAIHDSKFSDVMHACHCMIYAKDDTKIFGLYDSRAIVLMQLRFDGYIGFPGGLIDKGEDFVVGLNRELREEFNLDKSICVKEENHVISHWNHKEELATHFYALQVPRCNIHKIEKDSLEASDYGEEVLGVVRVPLYTMGDGYRGFPTFLSNSFIGNARTQLTYSLVHLGILLEKEVSRARSAVPVGL